MQWASNDNVGPIYSLVEATSTAIFARKTWKNDILSKIFTAPVMPLDQEFRRSPVDN
jgi:hypothetical protein